MTKYVVLEVSVDDSRRKPSKLRITRGNSRRSLERYGATRDILPNSFDFRLRKYPNSRIRFRRKFRI